MIISTFLQLVFGFCSQATAQTPVRRPELGLGRVHAQLGPKCQRGQRQQLRQCRATADQVQKHGQRLERDQAGLLCRRHERRQCQ